MTPAAHSRPARAEGQSECEADRAEADLEGGGESVVPISQLFSSAPQHPTKMITPYFRQGADGERALHADVVENRRRPGD